LFGGACNDAARERANVSSQASLVPGKLGFLRRHRQFVQRTTKPAIASRSPATGTTGERDGRNHIPTAATAIPDHIATFPAMYLRQLVDTQATGGLEFMHFQWNKSQIGPDHSQKNVRQKHKETESKAEICGAET
jgi:hypothetical protein